MINRGDVEVDAELELGTSGIYASGCLPAKGLVAAVTQYNALDPGGWASFDPSTEQSTPPWAAPMVPVESKTTLIPVSATALGGLTIPGLSLVVLQVDPCP